MKYVPRPTSEDPLLILYDGHKTHISLDVLDWATQNHTILFVLQAHTSHFLRPLDVSYFGPLESSFTKAKHRAMTGLLLKQEVCQAYQDGLKPQNLISGFRKAGICPFKGTEAVNPDVFGPATLLSARPTPSPDEEPFFQEREAEIGAKVRERRKRNARGNIVGGREITAAATQEKIRHHIHYQTTQTTHPFPSAKFRSSHLLLYLPK